MSKPTDIQLVSTRLYFLPVQTRVPLKFGAETLTSVVCARACTGVENQRGHRAEGWGETPLNVQWVWPSALSYEVRLEALKDFCVVLAGAWARFEERGHALELGHAFIEHRLPALREAFNADRDDEPLPVLAALVCCSAFDIAIHDAYGLVNAVPTYATYGPDFLSRDLAAFIEPAEDSAVAFTGKYPADFLVFPRPECLPAWHLVGGKDWIAPGEDDGSGPDDGYPVLLQDWITRDGLQCLKVKLRGDDAAWDYARLVAVGTLAEQHHVNWLSADLNCMVTDTAYVNGILDRLLVEYPRTYGMLLYVEQPFPYDLEEHRIDVRSVSARKPLFMDESAHDWRLVRLGRQLGWTGVALKTCKTQTGALLSLCWAKAHGMTLMVQDLTNPMLAQIPHLLLAAHAGTIMGVETNGMQFYPDASAPEAAVHPGLYQRRRGCVDLSSLAGAGLEYQLQHIQRTLPAPACTA
jgi:L-alanine-DL-glutamate epimerase-like enolase superfamily enzyme